MLYQSFQLFEKGLGFALKLSLEAYSCATIFLHLMGANHILTVGLESTIFY